MGWWLSLPPSQVCIFLLLKLRFNQLFLLRTASLTGTTTRSALEVQRFDGLQRFAGEVLVKIMIDVPAGH